MKRLPLLAGALIMCGQAVAGVFPTAVQSDSVRTKLEIKKVDFKDDATRPAAKPVNKDVKQNSKEMKVDKLDIKGDIAPINDMPAVSGNKSNIDEIKNMAKRNNSKATEAKTTRPAVSYPTFPGGNIAVREFVRKNQRYPDECKRERLTGRVEVMIGIAPDGTPHSATISKSSGNVHMDAEALRIADLMPKWTPAVESDDPQGIDYVIFVNFRPGR
jgi:TonB family protein